MADDRRLNLRFPPELFEQMNEKRFRTRTTFQAIGLHLFEEWLKSYQPPVPRRSARKQSERLLEMVAMILASGDATLVAMVTKAVDASYRIVQRSLTAEQIDHLRSDVRDSAVGSLVTERKTVKSEFPEGAWRKKGKRRAK